MRACFLKNVEKMEVKHFTKQHKTNQLGEQMDYFTWTLGDKVVLTKLANPKGWIGTRFIMIIHITVTLTFSRATVCCFACRSLRVSYSLEFAKNNTLKNKYGRHVVNREEG